MSESVQEIRCNIGGGMIPQEHAYDIRVSLDLNGVCLQFEAPYIPVSGPMVDALVLAWQCCSEHDGRMPLELFVKTFIDRAYNVWTAPVLRSKFAEAVELWRSKRTEVRASLRMETQLKSEAYLYAIALAILRAWPKNWEPGAVKDTKQEKRILKRSLPDVFYKKDFGMFLNDNLNVAFGMAQNPYCAWCLLCDISKVDTDFYTVRGIEAIVHRELWNGNFWDYDRQMLSDKEPLTLPEYFKRFSALVDAQIQNLCADLSTDEEREALQIMQLMLHDIVNAFADKEAWYDKMVSAMFPGVPKEFFSTPYDSEKRSVANDYFRTPMREEEMSGFGPCILPPVRFKSWDEYPLSEFPRKAETDAIRNVFVAAVGEWSVLNDRLCNKDYLYDVFHVLQLEFFWAVLALDKGKKTGLSCRMLHILENILPNVMTRPIITNMAKKANLPFNRVYDYLCAMMLWLAKLTDTPEMVRFLTAQADGDGPRARESYSSMFSNMCLELQLDKDVLRKAAATAPCDHKFEIEEKGENTMNSIFGNLFNGNLFGKVAAGTCKMDFMGRTAVNTSKGYKAYDLEKKRLINCSSFCTSFGADLFFVIPTNKPKPGDIILKDSEPRCVVEIVEDGIKALNYETGVIETITPERHALLGNFYVYGKVVSVAGKLFKGGIKGFIKGDCEMPVKSILMMKMLEGGNPGEGNDMMQFMLLSSLMKDEGDKSFKNILMLKLLEQKGTDTNALMPLMLLGEGGGSMKNLLLMQALGGGKCGDITQLLLMQNLLKDGDDSLDFGSLFGDEEEVPVAEPKKPAKKPAKK